MEVEVEVEGTRTVMVAGSFFWGRRLSRVALEAGRREAAWGWGGRRWARWVVVGQFFGAKTATTDAR